jgi:hypothetical protein
MFRSRRPRNFLGCSWSRKARRWFAASSPKPVRLMLKSSAPTQTAGAFITLVNAVAAGTTANTNDLSQISERFTFLSVGRVTTPQLGAGSRLILEGQSGTNFAHTGDGKRLLTVNSFGAAARKGQAASLLRELKLR